MNSDLSVYPLNAEFCLFLNLKFYYYVFVSGVQLSG